MNKLDKDYQALLQHIIVNGKPKGDRTGTGTLSVFDYKITHDMSTGFPLLTTKKMYWKGIVTELLWFLRGDTNIKYLVDNGCNIWNGDAYKKYHSIWEMDTWGVLDALSHEQFINKIKTDDEFAEKWGQLGPVYGKQWVDWGGRIETNYDSVIGKVDKETKGINQIQNAIDTLNNNPDSRRIMVSAWNVGELDQMTLPPCHWAFELYTEELTYSERLNLLQPLIDVEDIKLQIDNNTSNEEVFTYYNVPTRRLHLKWHQRSVDTFLGLPFNIASYGLLLEIIAKAVNMVPGTLVGDLTNVHLYNNHMEQAKEQISRDSFDLPKLKHLRSNDKYTLLTEFSSLWNEIKLSDFEIENYQSHPPIKAPLSN